MRIIDADGHVLEREIPWAELIDEPYDRARRARCKTTAGLISS